MSKREIEMVMAELMAVVVEAKGVGVNGGDGRGGQQRGRRRRRGRRQREEKNKMNKRIWDLFGDFRQIFIFFWR